MVWQDNIWKELNRMQRQMDRIFGGFLTDGKDYRNEMIDELSTGYRRAFANFKETDKEFIIQVEIPGVDKEDVKLNVTENGVEIRAEKKKEKEEGNEGRSYRYTKNYSGFYQAFDVPENADLENIDASYKNGVLTIKLPKKTKVEQKRSIQIK